MNNSINALLPGAQTASTIVCTFNKPYILLFNREEDGHWYVNRQFFPLGLHRRMMVACADELCSFLSNDNRTVRIEAYPGYEPFDKTGYACLVRGHHSLVSGSHYQVKGIPGFKGEVWLCPSTLLALGYYPKRIYIRKWSD